uniref:Uncharacterized protein n=1 Tax=Zea mays TaxID=4577 RepID=B4FM34_MAIZE|nr:unknown [Zea mays]
MLLPSQNDVFLTMTRCCSFPNMKRIDLVSCRSQKYYLLGDFGEAIAFVHH